MPALYAVNGLFAQKTLFNPVRSLKRGTRHQPPPAVENLSSTRVRVEHVFAQLKGWRALTNAHFHHERVAQPAKVILNWLIR